MAEPFLSEIRMMSFNFPPKGWAFCNGQLMPINQNQALFSLLGTTYGGDGRVNFGLPDLRGRVPIHMGGGQTLGGRGGEEAHTVSTSEMPTHFHTLSGSSSQGNTPNPNLNSVGNVLAQDPGNAYGPPNNLTNLKTGSIANVGGSQAHLNMQPFLTINFSIALQGIFPSQT
ncbi:phage tail protein [Bradyrhizobium sp. USDA 3364]